MPGDSSLLVGIAIALAAGVISFLSPCVLPLVPAYLGQLTTVTVASGAAAGTAPSRWFALRHAFAYVLGFGAVFTILGVTATFVGGPLVDWLPGLRTVGGFFLILLGLNLAGVLSIPTLERVWRPMEAGAQATLASTSGGIALAPVGAPGRMDRIGGRLVGSRNGWIASFGLGAIFAIGWTPCIGTILGGILTMAATSGTLGQGAVLLVAYTAGLGIPFLLVGVLYDRAPALLHPLVRHGRAVSIVGGVLVAGIGVAMIFDWLSLLPRYFTFLSGI
jgi:cytochrome c-type biogenesis protein